VHRSADWFAADEWQQDNELTCLLGTCEQFCCHDLAEAHTIRPPFAIWNLLTADVEGAFPPVSMVDSLLWDARDVRVAEISRVRGAAYASLFGHFWSPMSNLRCCLGDLSQLSWLSSALSWKTGQDVIRKYVVDKVRPDLPPPWKALPSQAESWRAFRTAWISVLSKTQYTAWPATNNSRGCVSNLRLVCCWMLLVAPEAFSVQTSCFSSQRFLESQT
jgi:hypothetical protein